MFAHVTEFFLNLGIPSKFIPFAYTLAVMVALLLISYIVNAINLLILRALPGNSGFAVCRWLTAPGVVIHECSHALLAFLTGAKVTKIVFFGPKGDVLGYVSYKTRGRFLAPAIQQMLASVAPVLIGPLVIWGLAELFLITDPVWVKALLIYLVFCVLMHMDLSGQDVRIYLKGCAVVLIVVALVCLLFIM